MSILFIYFSIIFISHMSNLCYQTLKQNRTEHWHLKQKLFMLKYLKLSLDTLKCLERNPLFKAPAFSFSRFGQGQEEYDLEDEEILGSSDEEILGSSDEEVDPNRTKGDFITTQDFEGYGERNFIDRVKMKVIGGKGGDGAFTFYRDRYVRTGAPDGGDGGPGGSVYFKASSFFTDLRHIRRVKIQGNNGKSGRRQKKDGREGRDLYYSVPIGTLVWELKLVQKMENEDLQDSAEDTVKGRGVKKTSIKRKLLADLGEEGKEVLVAKGGRGGNGNGMHRGLIDAAEKGKPGEEVDVYLELKSLADIGLVGYPNAGKSTILATFTRALAKIAPYPFTTLQPTVGKIKFIDEFSMTMADIPGLIEGSHANKGLGHEFLRHIERTKVLMYVIDITSDDIINEFNVLKRELELYNKKIFETKPAVLVLNKIDLLENHEEVIESVRKAVGLEVLGMSAKYSSHLDKVVVKLREIVYAKREKETAERLAEEEEIRNRELEFR